MFEIYDFISIFLDFKFFLYLSGTLFAPIFKVEHVSAENALFDAFGTN